MTDIRMKLAPPWVTYVNELTVLFGCDDQINIVYDNDKREVKLYIEDAQKAAAIDYLLPDVVTYGNVSLDVTVYPANGIYELPENPNLELVFNMAFADNSVLAYTRTISGLFNNSITYVVFKHEVVQFFNDNLNDIFGNVSTLYQEIAKDVFDDEVLNGIYFCTDVKREEAELLGNSIENTMGSWHVHVDTDNLPSAVVDAFEQLDDLLGASYKPIACVGTQVANGINYAVVAKQSIISGRDVDNIVMIIVNEKPNHGNAAIVSIEPMISGGALFGGFDVKVEVGEMINKTARTLFENRFMGHLGMIIKPIAFLGTKVVKGTEYTFLCKGTPTPVYEEEDNDKILLVTVNDFDSGICIVDVLNKYDGLVSNSIQEVTNKLGRPLGEWP